MGVIHFWISVFVLISQQMIAGTADTADPANLMGCMRCNSFIGMQV